MIRRLFQLFIIAQYSLWSCVSALGAESVTELELAHLSGLLIENPTNNDVALVLKKKSQIYQKLQLTKPSLSTKTETLQLTTKALNLHQIRKLFNDCLKDSRGREYADRIFNAARGTNPGLIKNPCHAINTDPSIDQMDDLGRFINQKNQMNLKNKVLEQSQLNLAKTYFYWDRRIDHGHPLATVHTLCVNVACTESDRKLYVESLNQIDKEQPHSEQKKDPKKTAEQLIEFKKNNTDEYRKNDELLLLSTSLKNRNLISSQNVLQAQSEVTELMIQQLKTIKDMDFSNLVATNPAAVGQVLLENPEWTPLVCKTIQDIVRTQAHQEKWEKVYLWGGLIVGGTLLATGIGAAAGALTLSEVAMTGVIISAATVTASDLLYSGIRSTDSMDQAQQLRASFLSKNGDKKTQEESNAKIEESYSHFISAGIDVVSLVPFGALWRIMSRTAQVARVGGTSQVAKITAIDNQAVLSNLEKMMSEIKSPQIQNVLLKAKTKVSEEDFGSFLGQLSQLSPDARKLVYEKMLKAPEKVSLAIEKGAKAGRDLCR